MNENFSKIQMPGWLPGGDVEASIWLVHNWHTSVGELKFDNGESCSFVGELTRWRKDRYSSSREDMTSIIDLAPNGWESITPVSRRSRVQIPLKPWFVSLEIMKFVIHWARLRRLSFSFRAMWLLTYLLQRRFCHVVLAFEVGLQS